MIEVKELDAQRIAPQILSHIAARMQVHALDLRSASRAGPIAAKRAIAMWVFRQLNLSFPDVGTLFGGRDHTVAISACRTVEARREGDEGYRQETDALLSEARALVGEVQDDLPSPAMVPGDREPPILTLLKTTRDELDRVARDTRRLALLVDSAIARLEGRSAQPITLNVQHQDEEVPQ